MHRYHCYLHGSGGLAACAALLCSCELACLHSLLQMAFDPSWQTFAPNFLFRWAAQGLHWAVPALERPLQPRWPQQQLWQRPVLLERQQVWWGLLQAQQTSR